MAEVARTRSSEGTNRRSDRKAFVRAWLTAAAFSGVPSMSVSVVRRDDVLESTRVIGRVVTRADDDRAALLVGVVAHVAISLGWTAVVRALVPREQTTLDQRAFRGALLGAAIAVLDVCLIGRHMPEIRDLDALPQVADHLAFGALAAL